MLRRSVLSAARLLGQKGSAVPAAPRLCLSTAAQREPKFMVRRDPFVDPKQVKVPFLRDSVRQEMYVRHVTNPEQWTLAALSQQYHTSLDRAKAVVVLMHQRYEAIRARGLTVHLDEQLNTVTVEVPAAWRALYAKHSEDPSQGAEQALQKANEAAEESNKLRVNGERAQEIIDIVRDHERRSANLAFFEQHMDGVLQQLSDRGVNAHVFQETANDVAVKGGQKSLKDSFFPSLFGDDDEEREKARLLRRIASETKAQVEFTVEHFHEKYAPSPADETETEKKTTSPETPSRWKLAFRDLSQVDTLAGQNDVTRTLIRSRKGNLRSATPLEEQERSWNTRPSEMDKQFNVITKQRAERFVQPFSNVDKDDHLTAQLAQKKLEKTRKIEETTGKK